jgi:hypothetical protein
LFLLYLGISFCIDNASGSQLSGLKPVSFWTLYAVLRALVNAVFREATPFALWQTASSIPTPVLEKST